MPLLVCVVLHERDVYDCGVLLCGAPLFYNMCCIGGWRVPLFHVYWCRSMMPHDVCS